MPGIHEMTYSVRPYEAGYGKTALPGAMLNYLQDAAFEHSLSLGFSVFDLFPMGLTWVLSRYHVRVLRYPLSGERIHIRTWYPGSQAPFHLREWKISDGKGEDLVLATSSWLIVDLSTGRPAANGSVVLKDLPVTTKRALEDDFSALPVPRREDVRKSFQVRISDTDMNRHVNHVQHILWSLESVPGDCLAEWVPVEMEAAYKGEVLFGKEVSVLTGAAGEGTFVHQLVLEPGGKEVARVRTLWKRGKGTAGREP